MSSANFVWGVGLSPRGNDSPNAASNSSTSPVKFLGALGAWFKAFAAKTHRTAPLMDGLDFHPYPVPQSLPFATGYPTPNNASISNLPRIYQAFYDGFNGSPQIVEGMGTAPAKATREFFVNRAQRGAPATTATAPDSSATQRAASNADMPTMAGARSGMIPSTGPLAATVPAVLDACVTALDQFGTKSLSEVMQPAIELADGFPIDELRVQYIKTRAPIFSQWPDAKRIFLPNGEVPKVGDVFVQADLARTLRAIAGAEKQNARRGRHAALMAARDYFYRGPVGKRIGDYMQTHGGLLAASDLAGWHARVGAPARGEYRGYEIYKTGFWAQGPMMIEVLNLLEGYDLKKMGQNSPEYIHTVTEALKLGFADRDRFYGDPNFVKIPTQELLSKNYAAMRRTLIDEQKASLAQRPGDPTNMKPLLASATTISYNAAPVPEIEKANDTTCVNVIDKDGNMFSWLEWSTSS